MDHSGLNSTPAASDLEVVSVERLQGYLAVLDAILEVCRQAEREGASRSRARCKVMLADCRKRFCGRLKRIDHPHQTAWEMGFCDLLEVLWETLNPVPHVSDTELLGRVKKAHGLASTLEKMLSAMVVLESIDPVDVEEALERFYGVHESVPF